jgi:hypothetical protein
MISKFNYFIKDRMIMIQIIVEKFNILLKLDCYDSRI